MEVIGTQENAFRVTYSHWTCFHGQRVAACPQSLGFVIVSLTCTLVKGMQMAFRSIRLLE